MAVPRLRTGHRPGRLICFLVLLLALAASADAGTLSGRVLDPAGRPVAGATVLVDGPLGVRTTTTDADGRFHIADLADASYRVLVESPGFASPARTVRTGAETTPIDLHLRIAPYSEAVVVASAFVPRPRSESPASTTVVTSEDVTARQLENVADVLRTTPGFAVGRNGGRGALTSVFPRGGESDYTLVLVDGIRVNSFGGGFDFSLLPLGDVEQVEIVRGPQSAVFGADAIGGVVHLTTRQGGRPTVSGQIEGGGQATLRAVAATRGAVGAWSFGASGERNQSDGFTGIAPATGETVSNDDWEQSLAQGHLEWTRSVTTAVRADFRWIDAERGNPGPVWQQPDWRLHGGRSRVARRGHTASTWPARTLALGISARRPYSAALAAHPCRPRQPLSQQFRRLVLRDTPLQRSHADRCRLTPTTGLTAGVEGFSERARSTYITGERFQEVPIERRTVGGFAELRQDLGARASVSAGLRADAIRRNRLEGDPNPFGPRPAFADESVTSVNPRLAGRLVAWQDRGGVARTTLRASFGTGIRPPDAFEIAFTDNPASSRNAAAALTSASATSCCRR